MDRQTDRSRYRLMPPYGGAGHNNYVGLVCRLLVIRSSMLLADHATMSDLLTSDVTRTWLSSLGRLLQRTDCFSGNLHSL